MPSIGFDRAATYYDSTRGFAEGVDEQIRAAIVAYTHTDRQSRFLELGVGTGRIALPFIRGGYDYTGIDISQAMMAQLRHKLAADSGASNYRYRLVQGDVTRLPFADASFDVAIEVHVLHLVDGWQDALREAARVLRKPGGYLLSGFDVFAESEAEATSPATQVRKKWDAILRELGVERDALLPGVRPAQNDLGQQVEVYLCELGATVEVMTFVEHATPALSARVMAQRHVDRLYSSDWLLPDATHAEAAQRIQAWLNTEHPDPDMPVSSRVAFKAHVAHW